MYSMKLGTLIMYMVISGVVAGSGVLVIEKFTERDEPSCLSEADQQFLNKRPIDTPSKGY
jgi:hypothetical protein